MVADGSIAFRLLCHRGRFEPNRCPGLRVAGNTHYHHFGIAVGWYSGLAGAAIVAGAEYRLTQFLAHGYTFSGIAIAFIARFRPIGVVITGLVIGGIYTAGGTLKVFYSLSEAIVILIEGVILLSLLISEFFAHYQIHIPKATTDACETPS